MSFSIVGAEGKAQAGADCSCFANRKTWPAVKDAGIVAFAQDDRMIHPANALGNRVWKSSRPAHCGVMVMRTIEETTPRNWLSQPFANSGSK